MQDLNTYQTHTSNVVGSNGL